MKENWPNKKKIIKKAKEKRKLPAKKKKSIKSI